jgi:hypothetical protein
MTKVRVFDSVVVDDGGKRRRFAREAFLLLPLRDRVRWILQNRAEFFLGDRPVDAKLALRAIANPPAAAVDPADSGDVE